MTNPYSRNEGIPSGPAKDAIAVGVGADSDLAKVARGFKVGVAGNVRVTTLGGTDLVIPCVAGAIEPLCVVRIWATNTTATGIIAYTD